MALHWQIIIALILGIVYALVAGALGLNRFTLNWIDPFGTIFIRLLKLIAVPLVLFSIISGITGLTDISKLGRVGAKTLFIYLCTTVFAISIGLLMVNMIKPGDYMSEEQRLKNRLKYELWVAQTPDVEILDGKSLLNDPKYASLSEEARGELKKEGEEVDALSDKMKSAKAQKSAGSLQFVVDMVPENIFLSVSNNKMMLQIIFFAIFFGLTAVTLPSEKVRPAIDFVNSANEVFLKMVEYIMVAAPFFVFCLMAGVLSKMADTPTEMLQIFKGLLGYSVTVLIGLGLMLFVIYPSLIKLFVHKVSYGGFFKAISPAQFLAFSTSSSAATLPVTMDCVHDNLGVTENVSSFVLPIGATVNMDGTSLYQAVAAIFLAQIHMVDLSLGQQLTIVMTATLASIGTAAVPSAGLVMLIIVMQSVGLNPAWIALIIPVDRILDMCRTVVNVTGDCTVSTVVANSEGELHYVEPGRVMT